jgi:Ras-related protein Rab-1A
MNTSDDSFKYDPSFNASNFLNASVTPDTLANDRTMHQFKLILIGDVCVGKSSIMRRYIENTFVRDYRANIGVEFKVKSLVLDSKTGADLQIWDTAGQERYKTITKQYYKGSNGILLVYDITERKTFSNLNFWIDDIKMDGPENLVFIIIGNKSDMVDKRKVSTEEGENFAKKNGFLFKEVSALNGDNISLVFEILSRDLIRKKQEQAVENANVNEGVKRESKLAYFEGISSNKNEKGGCC